MTYSEKIIDHLGAPLTFDADENDQGGQEEVSSMYPDPAIDDFETSYLQSTKHIPNDLEANLYDPDRPVIDISSQNSLYVLFFD